MEGLVVLFLLGAGLLLVFWWFREPPLTTEEREQAALPRLCFGVRGQSAEALPAVTNAGAESTAAPIPLSRFSGRPRRRAPPPLRLRSATPLAELPRASERGCEICKGKVLVWLTAQSGGWVGLCRRCGLIVERTRGGWCAPS